MNWDAIGAVGEILGAVAVVATLVYLARQVNYARTEAADANRLSRANGLRDWNLALMTNNELRDSITKSHRMQPYFQAFAEELEIGADDAARSEWSNAYFFWVHWGQWSTTSDDEGKAELEEMIRGYYTVPVVRYSWDNGRYGKDVFETRFVEYVDNILANVE